MHFWIHLFDEIVTILKSWPSEMTFSALALKWYQYLSSDDHRRKLYEDVVDNALATGNKMIPLPAARVVAAHKLRTLEETIIRHVVEGTKPEFSRTVKVMVYFDEAHILAETLIFPNSRNTKDMSSLPGQTFSDMFLSQRPNVESSHPTRPSLYDIMLWSFHDYELIRVFVLFLSRTPLSTLVPPAKDTRLDSSAHCRNNGNAFLEAPITETSFDECPSLYIEPDNICLSQMKHM